MEIHNFDTFLAERRKRQFKFRLYGETHTLPPSLPYDAMLEFSALKNKAADQEVDDTTVIRLFTCIFDEATIEKLRSNKEFDVETMIQLLSWALQCYGVSTGNKEKKAV